MVGTQFYWSYESIRLLGSGPIAQECVLINLIDMQSYSSQRQINQQYCRLSIAPDSDMHNCDCWIGVNFISTYTPSPGPWGGGGECETHASNIANVLTYHTK